MHQRHTTASGGGTTAVLAADRHGDYDAGGDQPTDADLPEEFDRLAAAVQAAGEADPADAGQAALPAVIEAIQQAKAGLAAIQARWVAACQRAAVHERDGARDTTAWLKDTLQVSGRQAKKTSERARRLRFLPDTSQALSEGDIGTEHADLVAAAMDNGRLGNPKQTEQALLGPAREQTPDRLRATIRRLEQAADADALADRERRVRANRRLSMGQRQDGALAGSFVLDPVVGETFETAVEAFSQPDDADTPPRLRRRPEQIRADGLHAMARAALRAGQAPTAGGTRPHISVLIDYDTLTERADRPAEAEYSGPISPQAARRLACDANLARVITKAGSQVLDVGRATPKWSAPQRRAIVAVDQVIARRATPSADDQAAAAGPAAVFLQAGV